MPAVFVGFGPIMYHWSRQQRHVSQKALRRWTISSPLARSGAYRLRQSTWIHI